MKVIQIPRSYVTDNYEMELIFKKIFLIGEGYNSTLKFPIEKHDESKITEIYEMKSKYIIELFKKINDALTFDFQENIFLENEKVVVEFLKDSEENCQITFSCLELGEDIEDIIVIDYNKKEKEIDDLSFGLEILKSICPEELERFFKIVY